ncbi:MAG TPA: mannose-1-phosphate guanylyltransferase [Thermomicrobiales bacterium]|nr:mannose-1-phosphate guanylyltransferase [Thermomicrobiales bacterium]HQZ88532.1 mannose-1-phosphate guanylyltransferase [Thermomicrobiales bacterium]HRA30354.1 mannose-1-phosphate guanylyltransferase [Thermomicrobiales bacterium]
MTEQFFAVIPAGGSGTRLWPVSRANRPKFLLPLPGPRTMIQATVDRLAGVVRPENILVITGASHVDEIQRQLPSLDAEQIIAEPLPRGSGPAIGLGAAIALARDPDAIVGSFAADHVVTENDRFEQAVRSAIEIARRGYLVTIGIRPSYPETGYGYIHSGAEIGTQHGIDAREVDRFKEKPDIETAERYVASGEYLWNASMFVWKAGVLMEEMRRYLPDLADALERIARDWDTPRREATLSAIWPTVPDITIDHGILEHSTRVAVVPASFGWTDLGDWNGLGAMSAGCDDDPDENLAINAELIVHDSRGSFIFGQGRLVALLGLENVVVIDTDDALLICDRSRTQEVKQIVEQLRARGSTTLL